MNLPIKEFETLLVNDQHPILEVTLNRPKQINAMNLRMVHELMEIMLAATESNHRVLILKGCNGNFCAGGDIKDMQSAHNAESEEAALNSLSELNRAFGRMLQLADQLPLVTITVLQGAVLGGGFGLACVSDLAIADETAVFGLPETSLGILPAQIAPFVLKRIGMTQTRKLALLGQRFKAEQAEKLGVIHTLTSKDQLTSTLEKSVQQVLKCGPQANKDTKALLHSVNNCNSQESLELILDQAAEDFAYCALKGEGLAGAKAFMTKQPAPWNPKSKDATQ